jgi:hypothetical protein
MNSSSSIAGCSLGLVLAWVLGQRAPSEDVVPLLRAQRIELVGPDGTTRMFLNATNEGAGILGGEDPGKAAFLLGSGPQGGSLYLNDPASMASATLMIHEDPVHGKAGAMSMFNGAGQNTVAIGVKEEGGMVLVFHEQRPLGLLAATRSNGGIMGLVGRDGSERWTTSR